MLIFSFGKQSSSSILKLAASIDYIVSCVEEKIKFDIVYGL